MLKAIKKIVFLIILMLIIFLLLLGTVGEKGYLVNREMENLNAQNEEVLARLNVKKESLIKYEDSLTSSDALDDIALKLGYNKSGEEVYFFTNGEDEELSATAFDVRATQYELAFKGLSAPLIALISFLTVILPYLFIKILQFFLRRGKDKDVFDNRRGGFDDYNF